MRTDRMPVSPICEMDGKSPYVHDTDLPLLSSAGGPCLTLASASTPRAPPSTPGMAGPRYCF